MDDFDENAPLESLQNLVRALINLLGEEIADDIVSIGFNNEFNGEKNYELRRLLKVWGSICCGVLGCQRE